MEPQNLQFRDDMDVMERAVINLINSRQGFFYASLILQMKRVPMKMERGAMGVGFENGQVRLVYDPEWLEKMTVQQVMFCLEHECLHLILDHLDRMGDRNPLLWNFAADFAVNGYILDAPGLCKEPYEIIKPGLTEGPFAGTPKGKTAEWYYDNIAQKIDHYEITQNADGSVTVKNKRTGKSQTYRPNDHGDWETMGQGDESLNRERIKEMVKEAYEEAKSRGMQPGGSVSEIIEEFINDQRLNWKQMLRQCVAASILSRDRKSSWKRTSRRFGDDFPGYVRIRQPKIWAAFDTSGSMSDEELIDCASELRALQKIYNATITVIECDAEIHKVYDLGKFTQVDRKFSGRGGTAFTPVFNHLVDKQCDLLIYFTDLAGDNPDKPKFKTIWVTPSQMGEEKRDVPFGVHIPIPQKKK